MRYYKDIQDGYIVAIGTGGGGGVEITESEYESIMAVIQDKPEQTETTDYHLRDWIVAKQEIVLIESHFQQDVLISKMVML